MVELVDTTDLKSVDPKGRAGSSPAPGTLEGVLCEGVFFVSATDLLQKLLGTMWCASAGKIVFL